MSQTQLHLFDNQPVVGFQVRCTGAMDITDAQAEQMAMHGKVVMVLVGTMDEATHKTNKNGDVIRISTMRVADGAFAVGEMAGTLIEMYHLDAGQQEFDLMMSSGPPQLDDEADVETGEMPARPDPIRNGPGRSDPALAAFLNV